MNLIQNVLQRIQGLIRARERGSILILAGLSSLIIFGTAGLAVDVARLYAARAELSRDVDAAALAGVLEFNGTGGGLTAAATKAQAYFQLNESITLPTTCTSPGICADGAQNKLTINANKSVRMYFLSIFHINTATVSKRAVAGFQNQTIDTVMVVDSTPSMAGTPLTNAKTAATNFKNTLLGTSPSGNVVVGIAPFRGCYEPTPMPASTAGHCIDNATQVSGLSYNNASLNTTISNITAESCAGGCSATNVCTGLGKGYTVLNGSGNHNGNPILYPNNARYLVLLSDGDNYYAGDYTYKSTSPTSPDTVTVGGTNYSCQPPNTCTSWGSPCYNGTYTSGAITVSADGFETGNFNGGSGTPGWTGSSWTTSGTASVISGSTPQAGTYQARMAQTGQIQRVVNLSAVNGATLTYYAKRGGSWVGADRAYVEVSDNGSTWTTLNTYTSSLSTNYGGTVSVNLNSHVGQSTVYIRFRAATASSTSFFYVDTVAVTDPNTANTGYLNTLDGQNVNSCTETPAPRERQLDVETLNMANAIKAQNIQIIVVAFGACNGSDTTVYNTGGSTTCNSQANPVSSPPASGQVGDTTTETSANHRLLKCIASSKPGTNDHYFYAATAADLPNIFTTIAAQIAHRLVE